MFARFRPLAPLPATRRAAASPGCRAPTYPFAPVSRSCRTSPSSLCATLLGGAALVALLGSPSPVLAQGTAAKAAATPAAQGSAAQGSAVKPPAVKKAKASAKKKVEEPKEEPEITVADADEQQILAAKEVHFGESGCEFDQKIQLDASTKHPGYVDMSFNKKKYMMKPVRSSTGALRLEDVRSETLMIQISSKTMLMNQKTGQRLVDNCVHPDQKITAADAEQVLMK